MDETINKNVRDHEIQTSQWHFSQLSEELYAWFHRFNEHFFDRKLQNPVISFARTRCTNLGHFVIDRNQFGLKWNININRLYVDLPMFETLATLLHEMAHQWQQEYGKKKRKSSRGNYHNVEFRQKAEEMGIPSSQSGVSLYYTNPFVSFLRKHGVDVEQRSFSDDETLPEVTQYGSKLKKWSCGCTNVRVAISDFRAQCLKCGNRFRICST
jgi:hypothetical protein